ncbi:MAG: TadE/TadG family type IV pilus assembly protein [Pseudomonadota bacterium]
MSRAWKLCLRRFGACREGAAVVEFAFVIPLLLTFIVGIMELARITLVISLLEGGLREASRFGITGLEADDNATREQQILGLINHHGAGLFQVDQSNLSTLIYPNFALIGDPEPYTDSNGNGTYDAGEPFTDINCNSKWDPDMGRAGLGVGGEIVLYKIDYPLDLMLGFLGDAIGDDGKLDLEASVAVRNEPFEAGDPGC